MTFEIAATVAPPAVILVHERHHDLGTLGAMATPPVQRSMGEEAVTQSMVFGSEDYAEMKAARAARREPKYRGR